MSNANSQEQTVYRSLAGRIQSGFYDRGARFPSVQEIALHYGVSNCPAQRALKLLEKDGLIRLRRGMETQILAKPYDNFLESGDFRGRAPALPDLGKTLRLFSTSISFEGMRLFGEAPLTGWPFESRDRSHPGERLYQLFELSIKPLGSRLVLSLYYDISAFYQSALLDILAELHGAEEADRLLNRAADEMTACWRECQKGNLKESRQALQSLSQDFFYRFSQYRPTASASHSVPFRWEPYKGRARYSDEIAIDLICKVNQGIYPVGELLPNVTALADTYHVSAITARRSLALLNQLGIMETQNGVGTRPVFTGNSTILPKLNALLLDGNLKIFLEALQLLAVTSEPVLRFTFPHLTEAAGREIAAAAGTSGDKKALNGVLGTCMQAVVRCCPLAAAREIYGKITLLLLKGSVLRIGETGMEPVPGWENFSRSLLECLENSDGTRFAALFRQLCEGCFARSRKILLQIGTPGVAELSLPGNPGV